MSEVSMDVAVGSPRRRSVGERIRGKARKALNHMVFSTIGGWLNVTRAPYMIEHRPDFHALADIPDFQSLRQAWTSGNIANNGGDFARFYFLYLNAMAVFSEGVPGDWAELGVFRGNSAAMLANVARRFSRHGYLFDTFDGFDGRDLKGADGATPALYGNTSFERVKSLVGNDGMTYVKGYFPDSLEGVTLPSRFAVAHIDCDLHDPMKSALEVFYPLMSPGGAIIMHDYASGRWAGARLAIDAFFADKPEKPIIIPDKSGTAIVRKI